MSTLGEPLPKDDCRWCEWLTDWVLGPLGLLAAIGVLIGAALAILWGLTQLPMWLAFCLVAYVFATVLWWLAAK